MYTDEEIKAFARNRYTETDISGTRLNSFYSIQSEIRVRFDYEISVSTLESWAMEWGGTAEKVRKLKTISALEGYNLKELEVHTLKQCVKLANAAYAVLEAAYVDEEKHPVFSVRDAQRMHSDNADKILKVLAEQKTHEDEPEDVPILGEILTDPQVNIYRGVL